MKEKARPQEAERESKHASCLLHAQECRYLGVCSISWQYKGGGNQGRLGPREHGSSNDSSSGGSEGRARGGLA